MASYSVTTANWNSAGFWSGISQSGPGHTLDFSDLPSSYSLDFNLDTGELSISNGSTTFTVGDSGASGSYNATLGGSTQFSQFDTIYGSQGDDTFTGTTGDEEIWGEGGNDEIDGGGGEDTLFYGTGDDTIQGGVDDDYIDNGPWGSQSGRTEVYGGAGDDTVYAGDGNDTIFGEEGSDRLYGEAGSDTIDGGAGNDRLVGGSGTDRFVFKDGYGSDIVEDFNRTTEIVDVASVGIASFSDIQSRLSNNFDGDAVLTLDDGSRLTFWNVSSSQLSASNFNIMAPVCFAAGTAIRTPRGDVPVETLHPGDLVTTHDDGALKVLWIGSTEVVLQAGHVDPRRTPVRVKPGAIPGARALLVSPQHCLLMVDADGRSVLARARHLAEETQLAAFARGRSGVTYWHVLLEQHSVLISQGRPSESFYPGPNALAMMAVSERARLLGVLPALRTAPVETAYGPRALSVLTRSEIRKLGRTNALAFADLQDRAPSSRIEIARTA